MTNKGSIWKSRPGAYHRSAEKRVVTHQTQISVLDDSTYWGEAFLNAKRY